MNIAQLLSRIGNLFRWWVTVAPWEQALRVRLGKNVTKLTAGVHLRIPWVDRIHRQSIRRRFSSVPTQTVTTTDGKAVTVSIALAYAIGDILKLYSTLHAAEDTIHTEAQALVAKFLRTRKLEECDSEDLEEYVTKNLDLARYGLVDVEVSVTDFMAVKTYRVIQGGPKDYVHNGDYLTTDREDGWVPLS